MAVRNQPADTDPVLVRLHRWATDRGMTRAAVAKEVEVSRPTVAGWFLALEAIQKGQVSASGRVFRYTDQTPEVQAAIARALGVPVDQLRAESLGQRANRSATDVLEAAGELLDVGRLSPR